MSRTVKGGKSPRQNAAIRGRNMIEQRDNNRFEERMNDPKRAPIKLRKGQKSTRS